jgi:hypothetical protein
MGQSNKKKKTRNKEQIKARTKEHTKKKESYTKKTRQKERT